MVILLLEIPLTSAIENYKVIERLLSDFQLRNTHAMAPAISCVLCTLPTPHYTYISVYLIITGKRGKENLANNLTLPLVKELHTISVCQYNGAEVLLWFFTTDVVTLPSKCCWFARFATTRNTAEREAGEPEHGRTVLARLKYGKRKLSR